jgi:hypothetical protein
MGSSAERAAPPRFALPRRRPSAAAARACFSCFAGSRRNDLEISLLLDAGADPYSWPPHSKRVLAAGLTLADKHPQWPRKT